MIHRHKNLRRDRTFMCSRLFSQPHKCFVHLSYLILEIFNDVAETFDGLLLTNPDKGISMYCDLERISEEMLGGYFDISHFL
jgi:hypothetical protein